MKIRSITCFINPGYPIDKDEITKAGAFIKTARQQFTRAGFEVQTVRLATPPFPTLLPNLSRKTCLDFAQELETLTAEQGFGYAAIGPALPSHPDSYRVIPDILKATQNVFASAIIADRKSGIILPAIRSCAKIMHENALIEPHGFGNLYFAALANVPPGAPFFPAAYHQGKTMAFALAIEGADVAVDALQTAGGLQEASDKLIAAIERHTGIMTKTGNTLEKSGHAKFLGIDFSLAPFPDAGTSLGTAMEALGLPAVGLHGSLMASAFFTDAIGKARFPKTGFNGLMLPLLEDAILAQRAKEGILSVKDLLMYSAVCGTGLDTIPIPGDTTTGQIEAVLLDLSALALRLDKPLTARLMPIPGKHAGEETTFDFPFFANSRVLDIQAKPLRGFLASQENLHIARRN